MLYKFKSLVWIKIAKLSPSVIFFNFYFLGYQLYWTHKKKGGYEHVSRKYKRI